MPCLRAGRANNHAQSGSELYAILPISKRTFSYRTRPGSRHGPGKGSPDARSSSVGAIRPSWLTRTLAWASTGPHARRSATRAVPPLSGARRSAAPPASPPSRRLEPTSPTVSTWIPLAKSPEQNPCGKIYSHHSAKLDKTRTSTLTNSTTMHSVGSVCRLVVISPTVSTWIPLAKSAEPGWAGMLPRSTPEARHAQAQPDPARAQGDGARRARGLPQGQPAAEAPRRARRHLRRRRFRRSLPQARPAGTAALAPGAGHPAAVPRGPARPPGRGGGAGADRLEVPPGPRARRPRLRPLGPVRVPRPPARGRRRGAPPQQAAGRLPGPRPAQGARPAADRLDPGAGLDPGAEPPRAGRRDLARGPERARHRGPGLAPRRRPAGLVRPPPRPPGGGAGALRPRGGGRRAPARRGRARGLRPHRRRGRLRPA